jgi:competence protein ComEA
MERRVAAGFLLAGVALSLALVRAAAHHRGVEGPPLRSAGRSYAGAVEVRGAVRSPGVLAGQAGRLAREAIALSGARVAPRGIGAETRLREGDTVTVLSDGTVRVGRMPGERLVALGRPIDLNLASAEDLASLPAIGPAAAARIVAWRAARGPFESPEELRRIPGMGPRTLARVRPLLAVAPPGGGPHGH